MSTKGEGMEQDPKYFEIRGGFPTVNVKMWNWIQETPSNPRLIPYIREAGRNRPELFDSAFDRMAEDWWEERVEQIARACELNPKLIDQEGRSGGWLVYRDRALSDELEKVAEQPHLANHFVMIHKWKNFVNAIEESLRDIAEDMRQEVAWLYASLLDERRERLIEEWNAAHPMHTTRPASEDPVFGFSKCNDDECGVCDGWGWVGLDELAPCPKCERGKANQLPRLGIDVRSAKYELHDVGTEANPYLNVPTVHEWGIAKALKDDNDA